MSSARSFRSGLWCWIWFAVASPALIAQQPQSASVVVEDDIDWLSSRRFESRQRAFDRLVSAGLQAIEAVEATAVTGRDLDRSHRCVEILVAIAQDAEAREQALLALDRLAGNESCLAAKLAKERLFLLRETDEERAIRILTAEGLTVHVANNTVHSVSGIHRDRQCVHLQHLPTLSSVTLTGLDVTDECFRHLAKVRRLEGLTIMRTSVSDAGLAQLQELDGLNRVSLAGESFSADGLKHLAGIADLSAVALFHSVGAAELRVLSKLSVRSLYLSKVEMCEEVAELLPQLDCASSLTVSISRVANDDLLWVKNSDTKSITLTIEESPNVTDEGIPYLQVPNLRSLRLRKTGITDEGLASIAKIESLSSLSLYDAPVTIEGLRKLTKLKNLRSLSLRNTQIDDDALESLKKSMPNLKYVRNYSAVPRIRVPAPQQVPVPKQVPAPKGGLARDPFR